MLLGRIFLVVRVLLSSAACFFFVTTAHAQATAGYTVKPGDTLEISVWKEPDLQRTVLVRPDGAFSFPLVGEVDARGKTVSELNKTVSDRLTKFISDAVVTISVQEIKGNKIFVLGQVNKPGEFIVNPRVDVMQALSMAGGLTPYASERRISIVRHHPDGKDEHIEFPYYEDILSGKNLDKDIVLSPGDVVLVPASSLF